MKKKCIVVIPIHSPNPTDLELISFKQCFNIIKNTPVVVLCPHGLDLQKYKSVVADFLIVTIPSKKMDSLLSYNKLKLSLFFYDLFSEYEYLLTYELDAFIFSDDIEYWCNAGLDYIGAPWLLNINGEIVFNGVGNSGFSLRRVSSMKRFVKKYIRYPDTKPSNLFWRLYTKLLICVYKIFPCSENITIQKWCTENEDVVISKYAKVVLSDFRVASYSDAMKFSFECYPDLLFSKNNKSLPTGCHAWWKYDLAFWKPFIEKEGDILKSN